MLGERLALLRRRDHVSQKELGKKINVSHYTISSYEKGRSEPNDEIKVRIARCFNVSLDYLMGLIDEPLPFDREKGILRLPDTMGEEGETLLREFMEYWERKYPTGLPRRRPGRPGGSGGQSR